MLSMKICTLRTAIIVSHTTRRTVPRAFALSSRRAPFSITSLSMSRVSGPITKDHRELEEYYNRIIDSKDADEQKRYQNQFVWELARHSIAEEIVVYPAIEKSVTDGVTIANKDRTEHQKGKGAQSQIKEQLYDFQSMSPEQPEFLPTITRLWDDLSQHIKEEEEEDLPRLEKALDLEESERLAKSFQRTKHFVPTHSHPSAPDKPPFETVVGMMTAPIDKLMDMFKKFPKD
ncbi:putative hemerythrin-like protein [Cladobotryum mycophilum]|uniref:Hemerythrin-like protein n=1 Tax=Cladobotryum mycophilum TaxID=491253 RepID=A0ABR0S9V2_9HYPO